MLTLILLNLMLVSSVYLLVRYFFIFTSVADIIITFFILYLTQITLTLQALGIYNLLHLKNVFILNLAVLLTLAVVIKKLKIEPKCDIIAIFSNFWKNLNFNRVEIFCMSVILGFGLVKLLINLVNPPFGWDSLNYHFSFPVEWLKNHNLDTPIVVSCDISPTYYPINGSLFYLWFILPLKNVFLADLGQIPFFIGAFLAVYSISSKINLGRHYSLLAASLFTIIPNYFKQIEIAYVDVMVAALLLISLNYLLIINKNFSWRNIILYSVSIGLVIGVKTTAFPFALFLIAPFIYFTLRKTNFRRFIYASAVFLFIITLTGGFGYFRNYIQAGNPFYPLDLKIFNMPIFKGVVDNSTYRAHVLAQDYSLSKILFSEGLGAQTIVFILPVMSLALPLVFLRRRGTINFMNLYFLLLPSLFFILYRYIIPYPNLRYLYAGLGVGMIASFYAINILNIPKLIVNVLAVICVLASISEISGHLELIASLILSLAIFLIFKQLLKVRKSIAVILFLILGVSLVLLEKDYVKNEYRRYIKMVKYSGFWPEATYAWDWLNSHTKGDNIAYVGRPVPFPLYGTNFKNNVYYVSVNEIEPAKVHYFKDSWYVWGYDYESKHRSFGEKNNYRSNPNFNVWLKNLNRCFTDYLFVYSLHQTKDIQFSIEDRWAKENPNIFRPVFENKIIHIYKVIK